jgi:hypothetical protein
MTNNNNLISQITASVAAFVLTAYGLAFLANSINLI